MRDSAKLAKLVFLCSIASSWALPTLPRIPADENSVEQQMREPRLSLTDQLALENYDPYAVQEQGQQSTKPRLVDERGPPPYRGQGQDSGYNGYYNSPHPQGRYPQRASSSAPRADYDPFYYYNTQNILPVGSRSRRNSKFTSNHLLNEDVHFFRRDPTQQQQPSSAGLVGERQREDPILTHQRIPLYDRNSRPDEYYASSRPMTLNHHRPDAYHLRGSSRLSAYEGRSYYPPTSNHLDYQSPLQGPRYHGQAHGHGREAPRGEKIDGWSVQVGTQLRVHDDGRARNPGQFYVRDEKPQNIRRYPHHFDYNRQAQGLY